MGFLNIDAAIRFRVGPWIVTEWEQDRGEVPDVWLEEPIAPHELCAIARRRLNWSQEDMAARLGLTKQTIIKRESGRGGNVEELMGFWEARGWPEPRGAASAEAREGKT